MSCAVVSPSASPRVGFPAHRSAAPLVSILRSGVSRTPLASPRTPGGRKAARIEAAVTDYFSAGIYEGATRTPISTPAPLGMNVPFNSPRVGFALQSAESKQVGLDLSSLDASLAALGQASPALSSTQSPYISSMSFAAAGSALAYHRATCSPNPSSSLSSRRRPSLRISDLPPVVLPDLHSLNQLSVPSRDMTRGDSDASATTTSSEITLTARKVYAGNTPGGGLGEYEGGSIGLGFGGPAGSFGSKRIPTPYPERKSWLEDEDVY
ncbi:uncharacterized protein JCM15063_003233 [Sporobolomyces koalae]|uniref:uncharacterized protein n=1 Tax=Sporobolomyces koalae TaxID=500713 RepID=UPI00317A6CB4